MRALYFLLVLSLLGACLPKHDYGDPRLSVITRKMALGMSELCYTTKQGISIASTYDVNCPPKRQLEKFVEKLLTRVRLPRKAIYGQSVLFVREFVDCDGESTLGCTYNGLSLVLLAGTIYSWAPTFCHELGHVLLLNTSGDGDGDHLDVEFWRDAESCAW